MHVMTRAELLVHKTVLVRDQKFSGFSCPFIGSHLRRVSCMCFSVCVCVCVYERVALFVLLL